MGDDTSSARFKGAKPGLARAVDTGRRGLRASAEDLVVAGLVAAPFAGALGIWLSWLTWWPNPVIWLATLLLLVLPALWIAGRGMAGAEAPQ